MTEDIAVGPPADANLDLTPREVDAAPSRNKRVLPVLVLAVVVAGLGFVLLQTLGSAALFFYNADEAVERRDELVEQRFRIQGTPFGDPIAVEVERNGLREVGVAFPISFDGIVVDVVHVGSPAELFQPGVPVVLEGTWQTGLPSGVDQITQGANDGWHFASTEMIVKHDNDYRNDNKERLDDADSGGFAPET
jgi:cytochrome c-type biogenesis protein CcmE